MANPSTATLGTIIANGTMHAFVLHMNGRDVDVTDQIADALRAEAKAALASILTMADDLSTLGESTIRYALNVECNAAAARVISTL